MVTAAMATGGSFVVVFLLLLGSHGANSSALSAAGRFILDGSGRRVKLRCANWAGHLEPAIPEGLDRRPLPAIAGLAAALGFNCVRLTWATRTFTDRRYADVTVRDSLLRLGLREAAEGVAENNGRLVTATLQEALDAAVAAAGEAGLMVILDNHVSEPMWCCGGEDGNGFFGDRYFDADEWLSGLRAVAARYRRFPEVVGMSLRNELRGPNQSLPVWYKYITRGARAVLGENPNLLVLVSGLNYETDLSFLADRLPSLPREKLVYEAHWYSFTNGRREDWVNRNPAEVCSEVVTAFDRRVGFIARRTGNRTRPLFLSEFGVDQRGVNRADNRFLSCVLGYAAEMDLDWAVWALQGSYYWRNNESWFDETYGVLDRNWVRPRNPSFTERFGLILDMVQDPTSETGDRQIIYHPLSGRCVHVELDMRVVVSGCGGRSGWVYGGEGSPVRLVDTDLCLQAVAEGAPATLSASCDSRWTAESYRLRGGAGGGGKELCLDWSEEETTMEVRTRACDGNNSQSQWFRMVTSNVM